MTLFKVDDINWLETRLFDKNGKPYLKCLASDKDRPAKPEEIVRQLWIKKLLDEYHYPKSRLKVEKDIWFGSGVSDKSADIVIMHTDGEHLCCCGCVGCADLQPTLPGSLVEGESHRAY